MIGVFNLWLPILLSAVFVFVASTIIHMVIKWHNFDYGRLPSEDPILDAIRAGDLKPGQYRFPFAEMKDMKDSGVQEKFHRGPVGYMTIMPNGLPAMGRGLVFWFLYSVLISIFAGYIAGMFLPEGTEYGMVARITGTIAILGYGASTLVDSIWKGQPVSVTMKHLIDGILYGLVTGGTFGWLWP
jgi:hypothetical protein